MPYFDLMPSWIFWVVALYGIGFSLTYLSKRLIKKGIDKSSKLIEVKAEDFPSVDIEFFDKTQKHFEELNFELIADIIREESVLKKDKADAPSRLMVSPCGMHGLSFVRHKARGFLGALQFFQSRTKFVEIVGFDTQLNNGGTIMTTTGAPTGKASGFANVHVSYVSPENKLDDIYLWHEKRVRDFLNENPHLEVVKYSGKEELYGRITNELDQLKSAWQQTNYKLTKEELKEFEVLKHRQAKMMITEDMLKEEVVEVRSTAKPPPLPTSASANTDDGLEWFHSMQAGQYGPVSLAELRAKVASGEVKGSDVAWNKTMDNWMPVSTVSELKIEKQAVPIYQPSPESLRMDSDDLVSTGIDPEAYDQPGIKRLYFWLIGVPAFSIHFYSYEIASLINNAISESAISWIAWITLVIAVSSRIKNLAMHSAWFWAILAPGLNLWLGYRLCSCPAGYALHKKLGKSGIVLCVLYWLLVVAFIAWFIYYIVAMFDPIDLDVENFESDSSFLEESGL